MSGQRSLRSETPMRRIKVARLGGWRAVSINLMVASEILARRASCTRLKPAALRLSRSKRPNCAHCAAETGAKMRAGGLSAARFEKLRELRKPFQVLGPGGSELARGLRGPRIQLAEQGTSLRAQRLQILGGDRHASCFLVRRAGLSSQQSPWCRMPAQAVRSRRDANDASEESIVVAADSAHGMFTGVVQLA